MRPPLELAVEVVSASGAVTRWDANARNAGDIPTGITFNTKRGDGFSDGPQITLNRRIDRDYADINLYDDVRLIGADGSVVYEGYIAANPRSFDGGHTVSIRVAGPMTLATQRPFSEVYIDRDLSKWTGPSNARQKNLIAANYSPSGPQQEPDPSGDNTLGTEWNENGGWTSPGLPNVEGWYHAPSGVSIGKLYYEWEKGALVNAADTSWVWSAFLSDDDIVSASDTTGNLRSAGPGSGTLTTATSTRKFAGVQHYFFAAGGSAGSQRVFAIYWRNLAVIGNHGLTLRSSTTTGPGGLYASDVITNICRRFAPALNPAGVLQTSYPIDHLVFEQINPYDAWLSINKFHLWELAVWEDKTLHYYPADLSSYDWQVRLSDPGVSIDLPGESVEQLANGIVVSYNDVQTGRTEVLSPDTTLLLADPNPLNPATLHGDTIWTTVDLTGIPLSQADAIQIGTAKLDEYNQVKAAGTITFQGHLRDAAGNWQPGWKVRASDTIAIVDHPDDRPRLIGETTWDHDNLQGTIAVDNTLNRIDAFLDRAATALQAANVGA